MKKNLFRISGIIMCFLILTGMFSCGRREIQTGDVDQDLTTEELNIKGRVLFTVDNSSFTEEMMSSVRAISSAHYWQNVVCISNACEKHVSWST